MYLEACVTTMILGERALIEFHRDDSRMIGQSDEWNMV